MSFESAVAERAQHQCELCGATDHLTALPVEPFDLAGTDNHIYACSTCREQSQPAAELNVNHWRCLNDSMWSSVPVVQVMAWRMLKRLSGEVWAQDLLDMLYLDPELEKWAQAGDDSEQEPTLDSNGTALKTGDNVVIIKDLDVKGAGFTAKRGAAVRGISVTDNPAHIEGRVNGQRIVLLACYVKKTG